MKIMYWVACMPIEKVFFWKNNSEYWIDEEWIDYIEKILGERRILLSAGLWAHYYGKRFNKKNSIVFADSGGFQYLRMSKGKQREFYKSRERYYKWQISVGDIVVMGDIPSAGEVPVNDLIRFLRYTKDNVDYQFSLDSNLGSRLLGTMHGISPYSLRIWYEGLKNYSKIGWAIGAKPASNLIGFALQFLFLYENGEFNKRKLLHVFGVAGEMILLPLAELIRRIDDSIVLSVDSSSMGLGKIGSVWLSDGSIMHFDDIRSGRKEFVLLDGEVLRKIPEKVGYVLGRKIALTSSVNYMKYWKRDIHTVITENGKIPDSRYVLVDKIFKLWKTGGIDAVWFNFCRGKLTKKDEVLKGRSVERLV